MKKLRMNLDELRVESFTTEPEPGAVDGTIQAYQEDPLGPKPRTPNNATQFSCVYSCHGADCSIESCVISCPGGVTCQVYCNDSRVICQAPSAGGCPPKPD